VLDHRPNFQTPAGPFGTVPTVITTDYYYYTYC